MTVRPKFVTFDCHGTMIYIDMAGAARDHDAAGLSAGAMEAFIRDFAAYRLDEVLGAWKPYAEVVHNALERTCARHGVAFDPAVADDIYRRVPTWGPNPDVPAGLARVAEAFPLVALTNSMNEQIPHNVERLGAPIAHVSPPRTHRPTSPRCAPSSTCSTGSAAARRTSCTSGRASAAT